MGYLGGKVLKWGGFSNRERRSSGFHAAQWPKDREIEKCRVQFWCVGLGKFIRMNEFVAEPRVALGIEYGPHPIDEMRHAADAPNRVTALKS